MDQLLKGGGELGGTVRRHEDAGQAVQDRLGNAPDVMGDDRQAVGGGLEVNEAEALDAVGHG